MKLVRNVYVRSREVYELDIDEELAREVETRLKKEAVDPDTIPHISVQTLAQCWEQKGSQSLFEYKVEIDGYGGPHKTYLFDMICDILNDWLWSVDSYQADADTEDWEDELNGSRTEFNLINAPNPDFPDEDEEPSPEGRNDLD